MKKAKGHPFPLGVSTCENGVNFSVAVQEEKTAKLLLYKENSKEPVEKIELETAIGEVRCISLMELDDSVLFYNYEIDHSIVLDPYVRAISGKETWKEKRSLKKHEICGHIFTDSFDWEEDHPLRIPYHEAVAYTLHVRGFTMDKYADVKNPGTFEGVVEKIPYCKELGINQIQFMPVYEFEECTEPVNYWGYGPAYYFAPKNAYSASGNGVLSLKTMIKELHKAGIEVILEMPFTNQTPKQLMTDCLRYYVMEYHIDGFICNHLSAPMDVLYSDPYLKHTKILKHQTDFKDTMRRFLKGDGGQIIPAIKWLCHLSGKEGIFNYITGHSGFTLQDLVSYNEKHNEVNGEHNRDGVDINDSWNCGKEGPTQYDDIVALRKNQVRNALFLTMLSQGTPCILAGDEWGNTQFGNNNVYCQDNEVGWLLWERFPYYHDLFEFTKSLIAFRKKYHVFHPQKEFSGKDLRNCGIPDVSYHGREAWKADFSWESRGVGVYYHDEVFGEDVYVAYNMYWEKDIFALPKLLNQKYWYCAASTKEGILKKEILLDDQQRQVLEPRSIAVFVGK